MRRKERMAEELPGKSGRDGEAGSATRKQASLFFLERGIRYNFILYDIIKLD